MGEFAGWNVPIDYGSAVKEVAAVRNAAGLFDVSHMGRMDVAGEGSGESLQGLFTNDVLHLSDHTGQYTLMCNDGGGILDDLIVYRRSEESFLLIPNAGNAERDKDWISSKLSGKASLVDCAKDTAMFALQGPRSVLVLLRLGLQITAELSRFHFLETESGGSPLFVARTGYTGEDGFELICPREFASELWAGILEAGTDIGIERCGMAARDILRIEAGLSLYGHEIDEETTPVEAGLMRFVKLEKPDFIGKEGIQAHVVAGTATRLIGIEILERAVPRTGDVVTTEYGEGRVTSGTFSPTLQRGIAMAYLPSQVDYNADVDVLIHGVGRFGVTRHLPFYLRMKR